MRPGRRAGSAERAAILAAVCGLLGLLTSGADAERRDRPDRRGVALRAPPRPRRERHLERRGRRVRFQPAVDHRRRALAPTAAGTPTAATRSSSTARSTTTWSCAGAGPRARGDFATDGDTEAIVAAYHHWGGASRLRGMFAFLIWDAQERVLFGARDPFGIKPLFVATGRQGSRSPARRRGCWSCPAPRAEARRRARCACAAALPDAAVRSRAGHLHRAIRRIESGKPRHGPARRRGRAGALFPPVFAAGGPRRRAPRARRGSPTCCATRWPSTCARTSPSARSCPAASTRRRSPRWPRAQPGPDHVHHRIRARGLLRGRRGRRVRRGDRGAARRPHGQADEMMERCR